MKTLIRITIIFLALMIGSTFADEPSSDSIKINQTAILKNAPGLDVTALKYSVLAYHWALKHTHVERPNILTVINFDLPSSEKRVWVIDLVTNKTLMHVLTSQGRNSGVCYARHFSNKRDSHETSLGVYKTLSAYHGKHGLSLRLQGLEPGVNSNAYQRTVVIHPAAYVTPEYVKIHHRTGRSWGCFAVNPNISKKFINLTKGGTIIFAYAKQEQQDKLIFSS